MTTTLTKAQKTRLVNIIIKRMERLVKKGFRISSMGTGIMIDTQSGKYVTTYSKYSKSVCALATLLIGVEALEKNEDPYTDSMTGHHRWDITGLVKLYQMDEKIFKGIEHGFMNLSSFADYSTDGYAIGQRIQKIAIKRGWMMSY